MRLKRTKNDFLNIGNISNQNHKCYGSGSGIRDGKKSRATTVSGMNILDLILENLLAVFWVKNRYLNSLIHIRIRDLVNPGSGMEKNRSEILDPGQIFPDPQHCTVILK